MEQVWQKDCANRLEATNDVTDYIDGVLQRRQAALKSGQHVSQQFRA